MSWMSLVGVNSLLAKLGTIEKTYGNKLEAAVISGALLVMNSAKVKLYKGHGLITGNLRGSIHIGTKGTGLGEDYSTDGTDIGGMVKEADSVRVDVGTNVEYAPHVEYGTPKMGAIPYLRPAIDENRDKVAKEIGEAMKVMG